MHVSELFKALSFLLTRHTKALIQIIALLLVGLLIFVFGVVSKAHPDAVWLYFISMMFSFLVIAVVIFWAARKR